MPMMKRILTLLLALALVLPVCVQAEEMEVAYKARTHKNTNLRRSPGGEISLLVIPKWEEVRVYEWGEEWCMVSYDGFVGYSKTSSLWHFRSMDPFKYPVPERSETIGYVTLTSDVTIAADTFMGVESAFIGTTVPAGSAVCVTGASDAGYDMPVWRGMDALDATDGVFTPFVAWDEAQPGDAIAGFTTFYNDSLKNLGENRVFNMGLGCERAHGVVIASGKTFSFKDQCGPFLSYNGYKHAPNISVDGVGWGGGVCQVSTTLYNAVLNVPLQIKEWEVHQFKGVDYAPQFFDCVVGAFTDFTFINKLPYDIQLSCMLYDGAVTTLILRAPETAVE